MHNKERSGESWEVLEGGGEEVESEAGRWCEWQKGRYMHRQMLGARGEEGILKLKACTFPREFLVFKCFAKIKVAKILAVLSTGPRHEQVAYIQYQKRPTQFTSVTPWHGGGRGGIRDEVCF